MSRVVALSRVAAHSGSSVSANTSTTLSTSLDPYSSFSAAFESSAPSTVSTAEETNAPFSPAPSSEGSSSAHSTTTATSSPAPSTAVEASPTGSARASRTHASETRTRAYPRTTIAVAPSASRPPWAQGKAGKDRVHVVMSEENDSVFVGIYDGFNGPDATDFLLSILLRSSRKSLKPLYRMARAIFML